MKKQLSIFLALSLLLTSCGGGSGGAATTMHLKRSEGTVAVADGEGKSVEPKDNLGLYSGYGVDTQSESYAWIDLDEVKLTKLDQDSEIAIKKEDKHLEIEVLSGSLFFNVTEPLAKDETMDIATSTMVIGIRGTCGWVGEDTAALLEGTVTVTAGEQTVTINAGEMAYLTGDGTLEVKSFYQENIPAFIQDENLEGDILKEVPHLYPLTVLTKQASYSYTNGETEIVNHFYDEAGYILRSERSFQNTWGTQTSVATYSYDGEGHCVVTEYNGSTHETSNLPGFGSAQVTIIWGGCFSDPLVRGSEDRRSEIGVDGRLDISSTIDPYLAGYYAIYTMDANGYPINIDTYAPDGTLTGNCVLEWAVIDP